MNVILLSGGSGTRLWPLSNEVRSKQFLKIFKTADGAESMIQRMYRMIRSVDENAFVTIAAARNQVPQIRTQLSDDTGISIEPCRRDTFPAIALACAYLRESGVSEDEPVVVCPVDPLVEEAYFRCLKTMSDAAGNGENGLTLMGIRPTCPSEKFGYILTEGDRVKGFREKPDEKTAARFIEEGALWNGGVFAFRLRYVLRIAERLFGTSDHHELSEKYDTLPKISFDYAVVEKEPNIGVVRYNGQWQDLGTWNTLTQVMEDPARGNATVVQSENTHVINELGIPMVVLGIPDAVIAATPDGILVSDKEKSTKLKDYVVPKRPMYEHRLWGEYRVLTETVREDGQNSLTKQLTLEKGKHTSYQLHRNLTELLTVTQGEGLLILDGEVRPLKRGDTVTVPAGAKHATAAFSELCFIEVQIGTELKEDDVMKVEYDWKDIERQLSEMA